MATFHPEPISGTSGADHLAYEVLEQISAAGYATARQAEQAWSAACRKADAGRRSLGYTAVSRPSCRVVRRDLSPCVGDVVELMKKWACSEAEVRLRLAAGESVR